MPASEDLIDSVANANNKVEAGHPAWLTNMAAQQYVAHNGRLNILAETLLAQNAKRLIEVDPLESAAVAKAMVGSEIPGLVANITGALKGSGNIPPVTP